MFVSLEKFTGADVVINFDDVRRITYDSSCETPGFYVVYKSGVTERYHIVSKEVFDELIRILIVMEELE